MNEGRLVDALVLRGDEGRGTLRKAAGRGERPLIRGSPNGETHTARCIPRGKRTQGTETSQYLEERTSKETPLVVASERGRGQWFAEKNRNALERAAKVGDSPVRVEIGKSLSRAGHV